MPYQSYTNDSDTQFAAQLDDYKLGLSRGAGVNDYDAAVAGFNVLSESLAVGQLMAMRGNANRDAMYTRKTVSEDRSAGMAQQELDDFSGFLSEADASNGPQFMEQANEFVRKRGLYGNKEVMDILKSASESRGLINKAKTDESTGRILDFNRDQENVRFKTAQMEDETAFSKATLEKDRVDAAIASGDLMDDMKSAEFLGGLNMDSKLQGSFSRTITGLKAANLKEYIPAIGQIAGALSYGSLIDTSFNHKISKHATILSGLQQEGIMLDPNMDDAAFNAQVEKAKSYISKQKPEQQTVLGQKLGSALEALNEARGASAFTKTNMAIAQEKMAQIEALTQKAYEGDRNAELQIKMLAGEVGMTAAKLKGRYDANYRERDLDVKAGKEELDSRVKEANIRKKMVDIKNSTDEKKLQFLKFELEQERLNGASMDDVLRIASLFKDDFDGTPEEKMSKSIELQSELEKSFKARSTTPGATGGALPR
jgi:hypothetical protein